MQKKCASVGSQNSLIPHSFSHPTNTKWTLRDLTSLLWTSSIRTARILSPLESCWLSWKPSIVTAYVQHAALIASKESKHGCCNPLGGHRCKYLSITRRGGKELHFWREPTTQRLVTTFSFLFPPQVDWHAPAQKLPRFRFFSVPRFLFTVTS